MMVAMVAGALTTASGAAQAGYTLSQIYVHGHLATMVSAMGATGMVGGTYTDAKGRNLGFLLSGGSVTVLQQPRFDIPNSPPVPTSIAGTKVAGYVDLYISTPGFTLEIGHYRRYFTVAPAGGLGPISARAIYVNKSGYLAFNPETSSLPIVPLAGKSEPFTPITPPCLFPQVNSVNGAGTVAGSCVLLKGNPEVAHGRIFEASNGIYSILKGPGDNDADGGFINSRGDVAGTFTKLDGSIHGFLRVKGVDQRFSAPVPVAQMAIGALSNTRYVAGTYTDMAGAFHGFVWHDGVFSELIASPNADQGVAIAGVSDAGDVALDLYIARFPNLGFTAGYVAHCGGAHC